MSQRLEEWVSKVIQALKISEQQQQPQQSNSLPTTSKEIPQKITLPRSIVELDEMRIEMSKSILSKFSWKQSAFILSQNV